MGRSKIKVLAVGVGRKNFVILQALIEDAFPSVAVIAAQSGKEGLDLAAKENPDVILLDIMLHEMDGFTLCAQFKADKTLRDIPVVFVIGKKGGKENRIKALESGADAFLSKPFDESELTAHLRAMLKVNTANIRLHSEKQSTVRMVKKKTANLKDVKEELQREQTILEAIFDSIPGYLYVYDYSGKLIKWNKQYETMTGYSAEELSHMTFEDWFGQEDLGRVKAAVRNVFEKGYGEVEAQLILKNEKKMMIRANGVLLMINGQIGRASCRERV